MEVPSTFISGKSNEFFCVKILQIDWGDPGAMTDSAIDFGDEIDFNMANITVETGGTEEGDQVSVCYL